MIVDLRWLDAWSEAGCFSQAEKDAGWPDAMEPEQLAALQRPGRELEQRRKRALLVSAITAACKQGALVHAVGVKQFVQPSKTYNPGFSTTAENWPAAYVRDGRPLAYTTEARTIETRFFSIAPGDFAAWLHAAHEEPSAPIAVWFEVRGVAWPPVLAVAPDDATPVSPFPLADFDALAAYRKAQKAANVAAGKSHKTIPWTDGNQLEVLRTEYERLGQTPSAYTSIANVLGTTRQAVESALKSERKRKTASPLPSVAAKRIA